MTTDDFSAPARSRTAGLSAEQLSSLRPYVVDLTEGKLSGSGVYQTTEQDVDAIFERHLPRFAAAHPARPTRIVCYAHGGLVDEGLGLRIALRQIPWWLRNDVYPLHFVWESGFLETLGRLAHTVVGSREALSRDIWDVTLDPAVEVAVRPVGRPLWQAIKRSAAAASGASGGATYLAHRLVEHCATRGHETELHAVGHSAGAIFHSYFVPMALRAGSPTFTTLQLLAPALRGDEFVQRLGPLIGDGIGSVTLYVLRRELEQADNCIGAYHKSVLYLVDRALESGSSPTILGLEDYLRRDPHVGAMLGVSRDVARGRVVWSVTDGGALDARSASRTHGGFDEDALTMNSVVRRVRRRTDIAPLRLAGREVARPSVAAGARRPRGQRRALCVGINAYPSPNELNACADDARAWSTQLRSLGFETEMLLDGEATWEAITSALTDLVGSARAGDVVVFQYSGHGTQLPDESDDEADHRDEALVPVDFDTGAFLIDDDIRTRVQGLARGVHLTFFSDCCHSGSLTRALSLTTQPPDAGVAVDLRARFFAPSAELIGRHLDFRRSTALTARAAEMSLEPGSREWESAFAACRDSELAFESDGQGHFTRHALDVIADGIDRMTNHQFMRLVIERFGADAAQNPVLRDDFRVGARGLLQPLTGD